MPSKSLVNNSTRKQEFWGDVESSKIKNRNTETTTLVPEKSPGEDHSYNFETQRWEADVVQAVKVFAQPTAVDAQEEPAESKIGWKKLFVLNKNRELKKEEPE